MSFQKTLLLAMGGLLLLSAVASLGGMELLTSAEVRNTLEGDLAATADAVTAGMRAAADRLDAEANVVSEEPRLKAALNSPAVDRATLDDVAEELRRAVRWDLLALADADGHLRSISGGRRATIQRSELPLRSGLWLDGSDVYQVAVVRLQYGGAVIGSLIAGAAIADARLIEAQRTARAELAVFAEGRLVATSLPEGAARGELSALHGVVGREVVLGGQRYLSRALPLGAGASAVALRSEDAVLGPYRRLRQALAALGLLGLIAGAGAAWLLARALSRPVRALVQLAEQVGHGDLTARVQPSGASELRDLGVALNEMVARLSSHRAEVEKKESRFRNLIDAAPESVLVLGESGVLYANAALAGSLGCTREALFGKTAAELVNPDDLALLTALAAGQEGPAQREIRFRGAGRDVSLEVVAVASEFEEMRACLLFGRDLTERRQTQARLMVADRMASLGTLAAGVAHEINNPLSYVVSNLQYASENLDARGEAAVTELKEAVDEALEGAQRVRVIVRDLKTFSRGDEARVGPVDVHRVLELAVNMSWNEIRHRARLVKAYGAKGEVPLVFAHESRLGQVLVNLLVNAAQAIEEGAADRNEITITTGVDPSGRALIEVKDTGSGMSPEVLSRIFDPFFTTKPVGSGTGLGLSISQSLVAGFGGELLVESQQGRGTTFRVLLPMAELETPREVLRLVPPYSPSAPTPVATRKRDTML